MARNIFALAGAESIPPLLWVHCISERIVLLLCSYRSLTNIGDVWQKRQTNQDRGTIRFAVPDTHDTIVRTKGRQIRLKAKGRQTPNQPRDLLKAKYPVPVAHPRKSKPRNRHTSLASKTSRSQSSSLCTTKNNR